MISQEILKIISQLSAEEILFVKKLLSRFFEKGESFSDSESQALKDFGFDMESLNFFKLTELREAIQLAPIELLVRAKLASDNLNVNAFLSDNPTVLPEALWKVLSTLQKQGENLTISIS